jgi:hypothetical protein
MNVTRRSFFWLCAIALATCSQALAHNPPPGITQPGPDLPPAGVYLSPNDVHATYGGAALGVVLQAVQHQPFALLDPVDYPPQCGGSAGVPGPSGPCEQHDFESGLVARVDPDGALGPAPFMPIHMEGPVRTNAYGRLAPGQTGTFQTEMEMMHLTGTFMGMTVEIRESPTLPSLGQTSIQPSGSGYHIDSFFDVFTELSINGGPWIPNDAPSAYGPAGSTHVDLYVPEPASFVLAAMALIGCAGLGRRR